MLNGVYSKRILVSRSIKNAGMICGKQYLDCTVLENKLRSKVSKEWEVIIYILTCVFACALGEKAHSDSLTFASS